MQTITMLDLGRVTGGVAPEVQCALDFNQAKTALEDAPLDDQTRRDALGVARAKFNRCVRAAEGPYRDVID